MLSAAKPCIHGSPVGCPGSPCPGEADPSRCPLIAERMASLTRPDATPTLLDKAVSLGKAAYARVKDGRDARPETQAGRERTCKSNVCGLHDAEKDGCLACSCGTNSLANWVGLDLKLKRAWPSTRCPANPPRWVEEPST